MNRDLAVEVLKHLLSILPMEEPRKNLEEIREER